VSAAELQPRVRKVGMLEIIGKQKATFDAIVALAEKLGQKKTKPALDLKLKVTLPNAKLRELDDTLYDFCYFNSGKGSGQLEGISVVSGEPNLRPAIVRMGGGFAWEYEQTGCTLKVYVGPGGKPKIVLKDCTVKKIGVVCHEGGSTDWTFHVYSAAVDEDIVGQLGVLKAVDRDIELEAPDLLTKQRDLADEEDPLTPETALAGAVKTGTVADIASASGRKK
jgi:hypothetical protein